MMRIIPTPEKKRVLVTGATTPIGKALVHELLRQSPERFVLGVGVEPSDINVDAYPKNYLYKQSDLTKQRNIRNLLFQDMIEHNIDTVIDMTSHRNPKKKGRKAHLLNVNSTRLFLSLLERHPTVQHYIYKSYAEVYELSASLPTFVCEGHPLNFSPSTPQWLRDRVESDLYVNSQIGVAPFKITLLRFAECIAKDVGSQLSDYLSSDICLLPLGFDPMMNVISIDDMVRCFGLVLEKPVSGVFNIPGKDTLPLSKVVALEKKSTLSVPGPLLSLLYKARSFLQKKEFDYSLNKEKFHFCSVLDGKRAEKHFSYQPLQSIAWGKLDGSY